MDDFGDRMKLYERQEAGRRFLPLLPVCARIDGKCFSRFTRGLQRPYDQRFSSLMCATTAWLVEQSQAAIGYTQSDEISLVWHSDSLKNQIFFDGRIQKMVSVLASMTTAFFNAELAEYLPEKADEMPLFDCRLWQLPNQKEAANAFLWRELDATKNSVSMAARHHFSHAELQGKSSREMQELLWQKGINWNDYPDFFKRGTFVQRRTTRRPFNRKELEKLPPQHAAHRTPDLMVERSEVRQLQMPPFSQVTNRVAVIFCGAEPETARQNTPAAIDKTDKTAKGTTP